jgi:ABC-2 type transport system ATP-binding protein
VADNSITVEGITKSFGDIHALRGIDLHAPAGKVLGLLGPNGAGKTTLVRVVTTLLKPDSGSAYVAGIDVLNEPEKARHIIGLAGQYPAVDERLTGRENLEMVGELYHFSRKEARQRARELLGRFTLEDAADRTVKTYSGGMRRRLDLAASIVARPQVLFLDEPTTGLDPRTRKDLWEFIRELVRDGATLMLTTQYLEEADVLADRIAVIDQGKLIAEGTSEELKSELGNDIIELRIADSGNLSETMQLLEPIGHAQYNDKSGWITLSVPDGSDGVVEVVRAFDRADIHIDDLNLRRPSLDDVFLSVTGKSTQEMQAVAPQ